MQEKSKISEAGWVPKLLVAYFICMLLGIGFLGWIATRSDPGVISKNAYKNGLAYNDVIKKAEAEAALGWKGTFSSEKTGEEKTRFVFILQDRETKPVEGAKVTMWLIRPTAKGMDVETEMEAIGGGRYEAMVASPKAGAWQAEVVVKKETDSFQHHQRIVLP